MTVKETTEISKLLSKLTIEQKKEFLAFLQELAKEDTKE